MTALITRDRIDGSKADTANGVNVANFLAGTGNAWDCIQTLGIGLTAIAAGAAVLTQANAGLCLVDASAGNVTITLPACSAAIGALFQFKRTDNTAYAVTISRAGADTIDGATSASLVGQYDFVEMRSDGSSIWRGLNVLANLARARSLLGAAALGNNTDILSASIIPGYLFGCQLSTAGASATMSITAGKAQDSTGLQLMTLAAIAKTTAAWAVGTAVGGLDAGAIANNTWYYFYEIRRPDTGVTDVTLSLSAVAPTFGANIPAAYTQYRLLYPWKTNGAGQWLGGTQTGDDFIPTATSVDYNTVNPGSGAVVNVALGGVPTGLKVDADLYVTSSDSSNVSPGFCVWSFDATAETPTPLTNMSAWLSVAGQPAIWTGKLKTNTIAQIKLQIFSASASCQVVIRTRGFTFRRGRDA